MNIKEWAKINNLTPDEFKTEIASFMAVIGSMELDSVENKDQSNGVTFSVSDSAYDYKVIVTRNRLKK